MSFDFKKYLSGNAAVPQPQARSTNPPELEALLERSGVTGVARDTLGFVVYVLEPTVAASLPSTIEGVTVRPIVTGPIGAL